MLNDLEIISDLNIDEQIQAIYDKEYELNRKGLLTVKDGIRGFYRLLEGEHKGRIIIKTLTSKIDGERVVYFVNGLTWQFLDRIKDVRCEIVRPTFN